MIVLKEKEITIEIKNPVIIVLIFAILTIFILELRVTFTTPINFGDEGWHTRMAQWIGEEKEYPVWVPFAGTKLIKQNFARPPLWNLLEGSFFLLLGFHESIVKLLTPFIVFLQGIVVYILVKRLFGEKVGFITSIISITVPSFVTYSVLFYTDILVTFYFTTCFLLFLLAQKTNEEKYWILSAIFGGLAVLTKNSALAIYMFIPLAFLDQVFREKKKKKLLRKYLIFFLIMILISGTFYIRNLYYYKALCTIPYSQLIFGEGNCKIDNFEEKYKFPERTEQVGTEQNIFKFGLMNYLNFAYGNIWLVPLTFLAGLSLLFYEREKINDFILLMFIVFLPFFFYSARVRAEDTARYTLIWTPIIAIVSAKYLTILYDFIKKYQKQLALIVFIFVLVLSFLNLQSKLLVMSQVKQFSPTFFEACDWVKENIPNDALIATLWSARAVYNCQRNCSGMLADLRMSNDLNYTLQVAKENGITHLFVQKFILISNPNLREKYSIYFVKFLENHPEHFKKIFENGPSFDDCLQRGYCDGNIIYEIKY